MTRSPPSSSHPISDASAAWTATELSRDPHAAPDKAARVQKMFAAIARQYDLNNRVHSLGRDQAWRRRAVRLCQVQPSDDVLDVACGTGDLTEAFCAAQPRAVTGLDFTSAMLDIARAKSRPRGRLRLRTPAPVYVQGDAMNLPFADESFDIVSIAFGIRNVADPWKALSEFRRVLRAPGGRLIVLEFSQPRNRVLRVLNDLYTQRIMPLTATLIARDRSGAYRYLPRSVATFYSGSEFVRLLAAPGGGFAGIETHPMTFGVCTGYLAHVD